MTIIICTVLATLFAALLLSGNYFYNLALNPRANRSVITDAPHNRLDPEPEPDPGEGDAPLNREKWLDVTDYETAAIQSFDNLRLQSILVENERRTDIWVILVHGYDGRAADMGNRARRFFQMGCSVLMPDCRGHGNSEGSYIGMGWHDRLDILSWIRYILAREEGARIILYGVSMGASAVLMASGEELPPAVRAVIADCGYTSAAAAFTYQIKELFRLPPFPILNAASLVSRLRAGYGFSQASALRQLEKSVTPTLFIHGGRDTFVPTEMVYQLYDATTADKEILVVPDAGHARANRKDPDAYWSAILRFLSRSLDMAFQEAR